MIKKERIRKKKDRLKEEYSEKENWKRKLAEFNRQISNRGSLSRFRRKMEGGVGRIRDVTGKKTVSSARTELEFISFGKFDEKGCN